MAARVDVWVVSLGIEELQPSGAEGLQRVHAASGARNQPFHFRNRPITFGSSTLVFVGAIEGGEEYLDHAFKGPE